MAPPLSSPSGSNKTRSSSNAESKNGRSFKPLATRFQYDGFDLRQIAREGDVAIYEHTRPGCPNICDYELMA